MAAFSYHHHIHQPFLLDSSIFLPNASPQDHFSQYSSDPLLHEIQAEDDHSRAVESSSTVDDNDPNSLPRKQTTPDSSTVVDTNNNKLETGEQVTQKLTPLDRKKRKHTTATSSFNSAQSKDAREHKGKKHKKLMEGGGKKDEEIKKVKSTKKEEVKVGEEPPTGYIHVRARRGQATDSHSLAERVRREKISERMKMLQRLVPGCDKVTGRAVMLDEIINYVQSLQNQVEFLSMKLASVNPLFYEFGTEVGALMVKPEVNADTSTNIITTTAAAAAATTISSAPNYPYLESAAPLLLQQGQSPNPFSQHDSESLLWDVEDQRQNFLNPSGFSNNLCSFN